MADRARRTDVHTVPLSVVTGRRDLALATVVEAGDPGIAWAVVSELTDPSAYLRGGELLLTAGVNLPRTAAGLRAYVDAVVGAGVSAVGFGVTPVHDTVPAGLVEQCHARGLPLVAVPRPTPFAAVSQAVGAELEERRLRDLRRLGEAHQALALAVTADAPVDRVLRVLAEALGGWALLARVPPGVPGAGTPAASGEAAPARTGAAAGGRHATPGAPRDLDPDLHGLVARLTLPHGPRSAKARYGADEVFLHTVGSPPDDHGVVLVGRPDPLGITDRAVLRTATALLDLLARTDRGAPPAPGRLLTALLLDGGVAEEALPLLAGLTGGGDGHAGAYRVLHALPADRGRHTAPAGLPLDTRVLDAAPGPPGLLRAVLADRGDAAHREGLDLLLLHGWIGVLSGPVSPEELSSADRAAASLLPRARAAGGPLLWEEDTDPFEALLDPLGADALARGVLGPLAEDTAPAGLLRATLRAWLTRHGNWDRAAADLGAHRNSVRYRIGRIERDLGVDLADAEQRMRLWFALTRWRPGP
ncbi:PucR family transcriptional regulator [Nocardiopsis sp. NPDC055824]